MVSSSNDDYFINFIDGETKMPKANLKDSYVYNPEVDYFFISVMYVGGSPAWIRKPFQTKDEVNEFLINYTMNPDDYERLEIYNEKFLRQKVFFKNQNDELIEIDLRTWLFDGRYSSQNSYYESILSGDCGFGWKEGFGEWAEKTRFNETV
jgi:hypothetical protein